MTHPVEKLWFRFGKQLSEYICRKTGHLDHCQDILQEVYIKINRNIDKVEKADNIGAYLTRLANNAVNDYYRHRQNEPTVPSEPYQDCCGTSNATPATLAAREFPDGPSAQLADCCLRPMIDSLPPIYRDALVWTQLEGMSQKDLARKLGISETGARSRVRRAREQLKEIILNCCNYQFDRYGNILSCCEKRTK
jgi:RNA polymerase sigma-70 factor (ECF subfamily)